MKIINRILIQQTVTFAKKIKDKSINEKDTV